MRKSRFTTPALIAAIMINTAPVHGIENNDIREPKEEKNQKPPAHSMKRISEFIKTNPRITQAWQIIESGLYTLKKCTLGLGRNCSWKQNLATVTAIVAALYVVATVGEKAIKPMYPFQPRDEVSYKDMDYFVDKYNPITEKVLIYVPLFGKTSGFWVPAIDVEKASE